MRPSALPQKHEKSEDEDKGDFSWWMPSRT
jgi:hypothetical protein